MKIRRLTPRILKQIIAEEKRKLNIKSAKRKKYSTASIDKKVNELTKLALMEAKQKIRIKKIKMARELIKKSLK